MDWEINRYMETISGFGNSMTPPLSAHDPIVILGAGYTGSFLYRLSKRYGHPTFTTSRAPDTHLRFAHPEDRLLFDLCQPATWKNIPFPAHVIWCFPPLPEKEALLFARDRYDKACRLILLGSTSAYPTGQDKILDESASLNLNLPRVRSEEIIRENFAGTILRLAGLYGPNRNVLDWIRKGKVQNIDRYVNLIHIEDVAEICLRSCTNASPQTSYIVSDGTPRKWSTICEWAQQRWNMSIPRRTTSPDIGKRLHSSKILHVLQYQLRFPDLFKALENLEAALDSNFP